MSQLQIVNVIGDISNFYTNHRLNIEGSLLSTVFLQEPLIGSKYPSLNPDREAPLQLYLYKVANRGILIREVYHV